MNCRRGATGEETVDCEGHIDDFLEPVNNAVKYLYSKFGEFLILLLFNSV